MIKSDTLILGREDLRVSQDKFYSMLTSEDGYRLFAAFKTPIELFERSSVVQYVPEQPVANNLPAVTLKHRYHCNNLYTISKSFPLEVADRGDRVFFHMESNDAYALNSLISHQLERERNSPSPNARAIELCELFHKTFMIAMGHEHHLDKEDTDAI